MNDSEKFDLSNNVEIEDLENKTGLNLTVNYGVLGIISTEGEQLDLVRPIPHFEDPTHGKFINDLNTSNNYNYNVARILLENLPNIQAGYIYNTRARLATFIMMFAKDRERLPYLPYYGNLYSTEWSNLDRKMFEQFLIHFASSTGILQPTEILSLLNTGIMTDLRFSGDLYEANIDKQYLLSLLPEYMRPENYKIVKPKVDLKNNRYTNVQAFLDRYRMNFPHHRIGFFSGSFDPLHIRHMESIYYYKQYFDFLLVGIDNVRYIKHVKKKLGRDNRKVISVKDRIAHLTLFPHIYDGIIINPFKDLTSFRETFTNLQVDCICTSPMYSYLEDRKDQVMTSGKIHFISAPRYLTDFTDKTNIRSSITAHFIENEKP